MNTAASGTISFLAHPGLSIREIGGPFFILPVPRP